MLGKGEGVVDMQSWEVRWERDGREEVGCAMEREESGDGGFLVREGGVVR